MKLYTYTHLLLYNIMINSICDVVNNISNWKCHRVRLIFYFLSILDTAHAVKKKKKFGTRRRVSYDRTRSYLRARSCFAVVPFSLF